MLSYCEISSTPAFRTLVSDLSTAFGDKAEIEAYRDYMEYEVLRDAKEIIKKVKNDYFSDYQPIIDAQIEKYADKEIAMTKKEIFEELGVSVPKTQISNQQTINLKRIISNVNNQLRKRNIPRVYTLELQQVGQSDNFTWDVKVYRGTLDAESKLQRLNDNAHEDNIIPSKLRPFVAYNANDQTHLTFEDTSANYSQEIIRKYAGVLKEQIGVDFAFITPIDAADITKNADNPWKGQNSFFFNGKAYFIAGTLKPTDILHEFIHPVVRSIFTQNKPLFDSLYDKLAQSHEGMSIINQVQLLYPNLTNNAQDFKEEVLVRALEKMQDLDSKNLQATPVFQKFINDLLYAIKQLLRKAFGQKIKVENLSQSTTLEQLSDMLANGENFQLDPEVISDRDLVAYKNEYNKYMEGFVAANANKKEIEDLVNKYFDATKKQLNSLKDKNDLGELANIMANKYGTGELEKMVVNLKPYQTKIIQDSKQLEDEVELTRQRTMAVINSLSNAENMVNKLYEGLTDIVKDIDDPDNVQRILYYQKVLNYWNNFVNEASIALERNGVQRIKMMDSITASVTRANNVIENFYEKASKGVLWDRLKSTAENIDQKWQERIQSLKNQKAPAEVIAKAEKDAANEKITPDMIEKALKGQLKDLSFAGAWLESYAYSPDPVVGGVALFVKDTIGEVEVAAQAKFNQAATELKPLLDKVGYNPNKPAEIGEMVGQKEKVGHINNETGAFEEKEIWRFLNEFTGADIARDQYLYKIKQASDKYSESGLQEDKKALADIQAEWEQHRRDYFHQEFTPAYYNAYDILRSDELGKMARLELNNLYDELNQLSGQLALANSSQVLDIADQIESVRRKIKQFSSLYDIKGEPKTGDELAMAERIQAFNKAIQEIYTSEAIPDAFEKAYQAYEQKLRDEGKKPGDGQYEELLDGWKTRNTRVAIKDEFWDDLNFVMEAISNIMSTLPGQEEAAADIQAAYEEMRNLVRGNRDEGGQPLGSEMTPEVQEKIRAAQERIDAARERIASISGLTHAEQQQLNDIFARMSLPGQKLSAKDMLTLDRLLAKQRSLRLNKIQRSELASLFEELDNLRTKEPTDSYVDTVNDLLTGMNPDLVLSTLGTLEIDKNNAYLMADESKMQILMNEYKDFENWFLRNHLMKEKIDWETSTPYVQWERSYAWNVMKPRDDHYYEHTTFKNLNGEELTLKVLPSLKYYKRMIKDEYLNKKSSTNTDNRGYWLPKTMAQGAKDDRYVNKEYDRLRTSDPVKFELLETMKKIHLKNQEGLNKKAKLYLDFPRYRKQTAERLQSNSVVSRIVQRFKDFYGNVKDKWDNGFNYQDNMQLIKMDLFDDDMTGIPMSGLSDLDIEEVSTDVVFTTMRYMLGAERNKALTRLAPVARMIQKVVNNEKNYPLDKKILNNSTIVYPDRKSTKYLRAKAVNNYIEKTFEGKINAGWGSDSALAQNFSNVLFRTASGAFLNMNVPSALKNSIGAKFQGLIESVAGKYMTTREFLGAEKWATATSFKISSEIYKQGPKSLPIQMVEIFDPERDRFSHHFGESMTRTSTKDYSYNILNRMTDFRRWTQLQASLQIFGGMMEHQKITTTSGKTISYMDAWEVRNDKIQTKVEVPAEWGVTYDEDGNQVIGEKFKQKRNEIQRVIDNLNGAMGKEDRPEADRYLLFRYISFFRRFLTSMMVNRFAYSGELTKGTSRGRFDYVLGDTKEGFYITFMKLMGETFRSMGKNLPYASSEQKAAAMRIFTEAGTLAIMRWVLLPLLFGWDPDDEDKFKKLRQNSDALPLPGVFDDPERDFNFGGWLSNHTLLQMMQIVGENDQFIPFPGYGLDNYEDYLDIKSMVMGPTLTTAFNVTRDIQYLVTGDDRAYYKRAIGPYDFQQEGEAKIWAHLAKALGVTGSNVDPVKAIKGYYSIENR